MTMNDMLTWLEENCGQTYGNFINGEWIASVSGESYEVYHAANRRQVLGYFPNSGPQDVDLAVQFAHRAFPDWASTPGPTRGAILYRFAELLGEHADELAFMLSAEQGKTLGESRGEVTRAIREVRFAAGEASRVQGAVLPSERVSVQCSVGRHPIGVVAAIAPWNFPVVTPIRKIGPALAYGCTVVYKPATVTPWTSTLIMKCLQAAGVPNGVVNLVVGTGSRVGDPLVQNPLVHGITFTGSTKLGRQINVTAAQRFARTQLELGGKNPAIVLDYTNASEVATEIVAAAFACSGQRCTAISRVIVMRDKLPEVTESIIEQVKRLKVGPAWEEGANLGPLINEGHLNSVLSYINIGRQEGATLALGGQVLNTGTLADGCYLAPTIFTNVAPSMRIAKEEIFGPVLSIIGVDTEDEAADVANSVAYGLAASVFTNDLAKSKRFAAKLESGMVHINHGTASDAHVPFGGIKESGFGPFSIGNTNAEFFTEMKVVYEKF